MSPQKNANLPTNNTHVTSQAFPKKRSNKFLPSIPIPPLAVDNDFARRRSRTIPPNPKLKQFSFRHPFHNSTERAKKQTFFDSFAEQTDFRRNFSNKKQLILSSRRFAGGHAEIVEGPSTCSQPERMGPSGTGLVERGSPFEGLRPTHLRKNRQCVNKAERESVTRSGPPSKREREKTVIEVFPLREVLQFLGEEKFPPTRLRGHPHQSRLAVCT